MILRRAATRAGSNAASLPLALARSDSATCTRSRASSTGCSSSGRTCPGSGYWRCDRLSRTRNGRGLRSCRLRCNNRRRYWLYRYDRRDNQRWLNGRCACRRSYLNEVHTRSAVVSKTDSAPTAACGARAAGSVTMPVIDPRVHGRKKDEKQQKQMRQQGYDPPLPALLLPPRNTNRRTIHNDAYCVAFGVTPITRTPEPRAMSMA